MYFANNGEVVGRKPHDKKNMFPLDERDMRLYKQAMKWNNERK